MLIGWFSHPPESGPSRLNRQRPLIVPMALALLLVCQTAVAATATVSLSTGDWPPYFDRRADDKGLLAQIIREAYGQVGIDVDYTFLPWSRALDMTRQGSYDGSAAWSCTSTRADDFHFSDPILPLYYVFFHGEDRNFHWQQLDDLEGLTVGLTQDYAYGRQLALAQARGLVRAETTASDESNLRKLLAGRIDLFPLDPLTGLAMINRLFSESEAQQLTYHPNPIRRASYHLIFPLDQEKSRELRQQFNQGLDALKRSGRLEEILEARLQTSPMEHSLSQLLTRQPPQSECNSEPEPPTSHGTTGS